MPQRKNEFYPGGYYHIYNRGANREIIFFSQQNYEYCIRLMRKFLKRYDLKLIVYCLMPNHYHYIIRQESENGISEYIRDIFNPYVQLINKQQQRKGTLFEGRFKHIHIDREEHLLHLCRYIHLNPVKAGLVDLPEQWLYSNYSEWIGERTDSMTDTTFIIRNFGSPGKYREFVEGYWVEKTVHKMVARYLFDE